MQNIKKLILTFPADDVLNAVWYGNFGHLGVDCHALPAEFDLDGVSFDRISGEIEFRLSRKQPDATLAEQP